MRFLLLPLLLLLAHFSWAADQGDFQNAIRGKILDPVIYEKWLRPYGKNGSSPVEVSVDMYIRSLGALDHENNEYKAQITFRQRWVDERLAFKHLLTPNSDFQYLNLPNIDTPSIWSPDLFFSNEKEGHFHSLVAPNRLIRIYPNGLVLKSERISLTLGCPMNLKKFPMDVQTCGMRIASYGYTSNDVKVKWDLNNPIQVSDTLEIRGFKLNSVSTEYCDSTTTTGTYGCIKMNLEISRSVRPYLLNVYIPTTMFVIIAYLSLWVTLKNGRIPLTILTVIAMALLIAYNRPNIPRTTNLDMWTGITITFAFAALCIAVLVDYTRKKRKEVSQEHLKLGEDIEIRGINGDKIDRLARIIYPIAFGIFAIVYWVANC